MRIDWDQGEPGVPISSLGPGQPFYYARGSKSKIYIRGVDKYGSTSMDNRVLAVDLAYGNIYKSPPETLVIPLDARVVIGAA